MVFPAPSMGRIRLEDAKWHHEALQKGRPKHLVAGPESRLGKLSGSWQGLGFTNRWGLSQLIKVIR
jgi:hypothetical protein